MADVARSIDPAWVYAGGSPGAWLCVGDDGAVLGAPEAVEGHFSTVMCELCGQTRSPREPGHREAARDHWESHVLPLEDNFDFFLLPGAGCTKAKRSGRWADVFLLHKSIDRVWCPVPPRIVAMDMAARGWSDAGMGSGVEWPRGELSDSAYAEVVDALVRRGHDLVAAPAFVTDEESYTQWKFARRLECSIDAVREFFTAAKAGDVDLPMRQWVARFDG